MRDGRKLSVVHVMRLQAALMALFGLIAGVVYSFGGAIHDFVTTGSVNSGTALAFLSLLGMPVIFGLSGVVLGLVGAVFYNALARRFRGLELEIYRDT